LPFLIKVYAAPGQITNVALQEGEQLVGSDPELGRRIRRADRDGRRRLHAEFPLRNPGRQSCLAAAARLRQRVEAHALIATILLASRFSSQHRSARPFLTSKKCNYQVCRADIAEIGAISVAPREITQIEVSSIKRKSERGFVLQGVAQIQVEK
jgi:hypothetical protein